MTEDRIAKLKALLEREEADSFGRYALALEFAGMNRHTEALTLLKDVIRRDPSYVPAYQQLGYLYQKLNRRKEAISIFKRGIKQAVKQGDLHAQGEMQNALDEMVP